MRELALCLIAAVALVAVLLTPASAFGAPATAPSKSSNLIESGSNGTGATSGSAGAAAGTNSSKGAAGAGSTAAGGTSGTGSTAAGGTSGTGSTGGTTTNPTGGEEEEGEEGKAGAGEESAGLGSLPIVFGLLGAAVLIGAIAIFILRDARRNTPVPEGALPSGTTRMTPDQARKRRTKAKAARQQRKRNRPN